MSEEPSGSIGNYAFNLIELKEILNHVVRNLNYLGYDFREMYPEAFEAIKTIEEALENVANHNMRGATARGKQNLSDIEPTHKEISILLADAKSILATVDSEAFQDLPVKAITKQRSRTIRQMSVAQLNADCALLGALPQPSEKAELVVDALMEYKNALLQGGFKME